MEYAKAELAKGIKESAANDGLVNAMRVALAQRATELAREQALADFAKQSPLLGRKPGPLDPERYIAWLIVTQSTPLSTRSGRWKL